MTEQRQKLINPDATRMVSGVQFQVLGPRWADNRPLWAANVTLLSHGQTEFCDARSVFLDGDRTDPSAPAFPTTMLVRCHVDAVTLRFGNFAGVMSSSGSLDTTFLIQVDAGAWQRIIRAPQRRYFESATCLAGQFPLETFFPTLPSALNLALQRVFPAGRSITSVEASSSGLYLDGVAKMPDGTAFNNPAPYVVEVSKPLGGSTDGTLVVRLDPERLNDTGFSAGVQEIKDYFTTLVERLNPTASDNKPAIRWQRLELTDPRRLPNFWWLIPPTGSTMSVAFASGEWRLQFADQAPGDQIATPRAVLASSPAVEIDSHQVVARLGTAVGGATIEYDANPAGAGSGWEESLTASNVRLTYDPVAVAAQLRQVNGFLAPTIDAPNTALTSQSILAGAGNSTAQGRNVVPPLLWGFTPLDDGWAQLPFFNLTEELSVDAFPQEAVPAAATPVLSIFRGAAVFGNDRIEVYAPSDGEPAWNFTILDAAAVEGHWRFATANGELNSVTITLSNPEVMSEGLFWLATSPPTAFDAIATMDDWVTGLQPVPLATASTRPAYPSPFEFLTSLTIKRNTAASGPRKPFALATLSNLDLVYRTNEYLHIGRVTPTSFPPQIPALPSDLQLKAPPVTWLTALDTSRYPSADIWGVQNGTATVSALSWRRHPSHPCIQAVPMTQNAVPPNYPSASRQLVPFDLPMGSTTDTLDVSQVVGSSTVPLPHPLTVTVFRPSGWELSRSVSVRWPKTPGATAPAAAWLARLPLASLGLPGLGFSPVGANPIQDPSGFLFRILLRHDLPVLDQLNVLADVPREGPAAEASLPTPPAPSREEYADFWQTLADRAVLAEVDEAEAVATSATGVSVMGLKEPLVWQAKLTADLSSYPGTLTLTDATNGEPLVLNSEGSTDALRGVDGFFREQSGHLVLTSAGTPGPTHLCGGSYESEVETVSVRYLRDQRALLRGASTDQDQLIRTPIQVGGVPFTLCSFHGATPVSLTVGLDKWQFWFKDLPTRGTTAFTFLQTDTFSTSPNTRSGVNDPAATGRDFGPLNAYEWRLGSHPNQAWLPVGKLRFYPLMLESATVTPGVSGVSVDMVVIGRLQLPAWNGQDTAPDFTDHEFANLDSAVRLIFTSGVLTDIGRAPSDPAGGAPTFAAWPLVDQQDDSGAPTIEWNNISYDVTNKRVKLAVGDFRLVYTRHGLLWTLLPQSDFQFPLDGSDPPVMDFNVPLAPGQSGVQSVKLSLGFASKQYSVTIGWRFLMGRADELTIQASFNDELLFVSAPPTMTAKLVHKNTSMDLAIGPAAPSLETRSIQFVWSALTAKAPDELQVLPGFHLISDKGACRGGVMLAFSLTPPAGGIGPATADTLRGYMDVLFDCNWSDSLQDRTAQTFNAADLKAAAFNSSAGTVVAEYTAGTTPGNADWSSSLVLSGLVEVKNLISWPLSLTVNATDGVSFPTTPLGQPLSHWRHTVRIMLSEHRAPGGTLEGSDLDTVVLRIKAGEVWNLPAVVEHQLVALTMDATGAMTAGATGEKRWVAAQNVRLCSANAIYNYLVGLLQSNTIETVSTDLFATTWLVEGRINCNRGIEQIQFIEELGFFNSSGILQPFESTQLAALENAIVVEASVPVFLGADNLSLASTTGLFPVNEGEVQAGLSTLGDFQGSSGNGGGDGSDATDWLFLNVPFLGRLQPRTPTTQQTNPLVEDPIIGILRITNAGQQLPRLVRMFTHRAGATSITEQTSPFDGPAFRFFRRLDASCVAEGWARLNLIRDTAIQAKPPADGLLLGVYTAAPSDAPAVLARSTGLSRLFDPNREALPPNFDLSREVQDVSGRDFIWTPHGILEFQNAVAPLSPTPEPYPFLSLPLVLIGSGFLDPMSKSARHPSPTLLPTASATGFQPMSLALSPFHAVGIRMWAGPPGDPLLATAELLAFDSTRSLVGIASTQVVQARPGDTSTDFDTAFLKWGTAAHDRLVADSPAAIIRVRQLFVRDDDGVAMDVRFLSTNLGAGRVPLTRRAAPLRALPDRIRVAQGQFTGTTLPDACESFELAPPLVQGVQPLRLNARPHPVPASVRDWPWGLSAIRVATAYRADDAGSAGLPLSTTPEDQKRLWWQSLSAQVQFALPLDRKLLPAQFRAPALPGYLPATPRPPLPSFDQIHDLLQPETGTEYQPVLPGSRRALVTGLRPGAPFAIRETLTTQRFASNSSLVSGGISVQHRAPRPILLPASTVNGQDVALRPWSSWFDLAPGANPTRTVISSPNPTAEFFLNLTTGAIALRATLRAPTEADSAGKPDDQQASRKQDRESAPNTGELPVNWNRSMFFDLQTLPTPDCLLSWTVDVVLTDGTTSFPYTEDKSPARQMTTSAKWYKPQDDPTDKAVKDWLAKKNNGDPVRIVVSVVNDTPDVKNYRQVAFLPVRVVKSPFTSVFAPRYLGFEDPEYNRELASLTARVERVVTNPHTIPDPSNMTSGALTFVFAADRREYNTSGPIHFVFFPSDSNDHPSRDPHTYAGVVKVTIYDDKGNPSDGPTVDVIPNSLPTGSATFQPLDLTSLTGNRLKAGGSLGLSLKITQTDPGAANPPHELDGTWDLRVAIVAAPTTPVPTASYALLRRFHHHRTSHPNDVEDQCVRFAWGPDPDRIELIDPSDLRNQVVRRRAVFAWQDTIRRFLTAATGWDVQKTTAGGSTHFPQTGLG